jgi:hypothetical protein
MIGLLTEFVEDVIERGGPVLPGVSWEFDHAGDFESAELSEEGLPAFECLGAAGQEVVSVGRLQQGFDEVGG